MRLISHNNPQTGFTLVELLIVIVVIAILAAISVVAYNGIQNRAKTSAGQNLMDTVSKKAEAFNTLTGTYPTYTQLSSNAAPSGYTGSLVEAKLDNSAAVISANVTASTANNGGVVTYLGACTGGGGKVGYWDYGQSVIAWKYLGPATASSAGCS